MKSTLSFIKDARFPMMIASVLAGVFFVTMAVNASTTISTDISTGGALSVTGLSTLLGGATTTSITLLNGEVISNGTDGVVQINGIASSTSVTLLNGETITNATDGTVVISGATDVNEFTQGGGQCTITDADGGAYVLTQAELNGCNYLYITASGAGQEVIALTLPATSTMTTLLPSVGDYREWLIDASDLAAATTTTITAGTGIDMIAVTNAEDVIDGAEYSELRCWRKSDTDVACVTSELINSD